MNLIIVSGLSGSGKSVALHTLEDLGYYCIDNLPLFLLRELALGLEDAGDTQLKRTAVGIDARNQPERLREVPTLVRELRRRGLKCLVLYLEAQSDTLIKRFSETRRRHPLTGEDSALPRAIERENFLLAGLRKRADWVIDTSDTNIHQLRRQVWKCIGAENESMTIVLESFAFKRGVPQDVDFIFDARIRPNPHWVEELREFSGLDEPVRHWLEQDAAVVRMTSDVLGFLKTWLPEFRHSQRSYVTVGIGCTGGRHRSVYLVDRLAQGLGSEFGSVLIHHRELQA